MVTCFSPMASSRALCVFGGARLISSTSTIVIENRARPEFKGVGILVEDEKPGDVRGQKVAGALDPPEGQAENLGNGDSQGGLAETGKVFDEEMAARKKTGESEPQRFLFAVEIAAKENQWPLLFSDCWLPSLML